MVYQEVKVAIASVWLITSAFLSSVLIAPHLLSEIALLSVSAALQSPHHEHGPCFLCGMTRAFLAISRGDLTEAAAFHRWSVALYAIFFVNGMLAAIFVSKLMLRLSRSLRAAGQVTYNKQTEKEA